MPRLLVAIASCSDAFEVAPLVAAGTLAAWSVHPVWIGPPQARADAQRLGLPPQTAVADGFAQALATLPDTPASAPVWLLLPGIGKRAQQFAQQAHAHGVPIVRWHAGRRAGDASATDGERLRTDQLAQYWLCAAVAQREQLLREGMPAAQVQIVGNVMPRALQQCGVERQNSAPFLLVALEHAPAATATEIGSDLRSVLQRCAAAGRAADLAVHAAITGWQTPTALPDGVQLQQGDARAQLEQILAASVLVTDSAGHQELAAAAGVPCVVLGSNTARPDILAAGGLSLAGPQADLAQVVLDHLAYRRSRWATVPAVPFAEVLPAVGAALTRWHEAGRSAPTPLPSDGDHSGRTLADDEVALAAAAVRSGTLNSTRGTFVTAFERDFATWQGSRHAIACASGSAAVHAALAALDLQPGDEVVTTSITDMGALMPILYQGAVPVFADVDPQSRNVTAATLAAAITARTKALVVTHLFGCPADMQAIAALAAERGVPVLEDCAQAFGATHRDRKVGTWGQLAAFSLQQGKHITCGEGGIVTTDDDDLARRVFLFVNKAWGYGDARPDHYFPALNYRLGEVQGAIALAQLRKLDGIIARRRAVAAALARRLLDLPGVTLPTDPAHGQHVYWKFALDVDPDVVPGGVLALGRGLQEQGIACAPRYVQKPAFACQVFTDWQQFAVTRLALRDNPRAADASRSPWPEPGALPGTRQGLDRVLVLPLNERYLPADIERVATAIRSRHRELLHGGAQHA